MDHRIVVVERSRLRSRMRRRGFSFVSVGSDLANLLITWAGSLVAHCTGICCLRDASARAAAVSRMHHAACRRMSYRVCHKSLAAGLAQAAALARWAAAALRTRYSRTGPPEKSGAAVLPAGAGAACAGAQISGGSVKTAAAGSS